MAAPSVLAVLDGVETALKTISGLRVTDYSTSNITPPQAIVTAPPISYRETFRAARWQLDLTITVLVSAALDRAGQRRLAEFAAHTGDRSIFHAFGGGAGTNLGGVAEIAYITNYRPLGWEVAGLIGYFGGEWDLTVVASGV